MGSITSDPSAGLPVHSKAPSVDYVTDYDWNHLATYLSLLYAAGEGHTEEKMSLDLLGIDPVLEPDRACHTLHSHLERARWLANSGYKYLLEGRARGDTSSA